MRMRRFLPLLLVLLATATPALAGSGWAGMKAGMTRAAAAAAVGQPLFTNKARGYEVWFFDHEGDVTLYRDRVLYWKTPLTVDAPILPAAPEPMPKPTQKAPAALIYTTDDDSAAPRSVPKAT